MPPKFRVGQKVNNPTLGAGIIQNYAEFAFRKSPDIPVQPPEKKYYTYKVRLDLDNTIVILGENEIEALEP